MYILIHEEYVDYQKGGSSGSSWKWTTRTATVESHSCTQRINYDREKPIKDDWRTSQRIPNRTLEQTDIDKCEYYTSLHYSQRTIIKRDWNLFLYNRESS